MLQLLSHRGLWLTPDEKNAPAAFARSFGRGFGTEADVRDFAGELVVAHDPPAGRPLPAEVLFGIHRALGPGLPLALNVKADGLQNMLLPLLERFGVSDWFVFDMAVPDALGWLAAGAPAFTRHSEIEDPPAYYARAAGVWLDAFAGEWWAADTVRRHRDAGKRVCVVSPELHGRDPRAAWERLAAVAADPGVMLCTDRPDDARRVLHG